MTAVPRVLLSLVLLFVTTLAESADWTRFRGPNGSGISADAKPVPASWGAEKNLKWKRELPGPGSSSPIVVGERVFVTCWSGYGVDRRDPGKMEDLKRHLVCIDRTSGKIIWDQAVPAVLPEDRFGGMFAEHGYATHTPASDGENVYVFFGKTGVLAFDSAGTKLWQTSVGDLTDPRNWGSSSSPILYKDKVIVLASAESDSIVALDKKTGKEVWREKAEGFGSTWGTPILVESEEGRTDLVVAVPYEIWGINPDNGKLRWYAEGIDSDSMCTSAISSKGIAYVVGGRGGAIAVRAGGKGDVTKSHVVWKENVSARITTPVLFQERLYWVNGGVANCLDAKTGKRVYQGRLEGATPAAGGGDSDRGNAPRGNPEGGFGGRGGRRGGGRGGQDYGSPVVANDRLYFVSRRGDGYVLGLGKDFDQISHNRLTEEREDFSASPAVSDGELFVRSSTTLYCVAGEGK